MGWYTEYSYNYCEFTKNNNNKNYKGKKKSNLVQMPNMQPHIVSNHSREKKTLNVIALYNRHSCVPQKEKKKWNKNTQHIHHQSIQTMFTSWRKKHPNNWHHNIIAGHRQTNQVESWLQSSMTQHLTQKPSTKTQINQSLSEFGLWHSNYQDANYSAVFFSTTRDTKETEEEKKQPAHKSKQWS